MAIEISRIDQVYRMTLSSTIMFRFDTIAALIILDLHEGLIESPNATINFRWTMLVTTALYTIFISTSNAQYLISEINKISHKAPRLKRKIILSLFIPFICRLSNFGMVMKSITISCLIPIPAFAKVITLRFIHCDRGIFQSQALLKGCIGRWPRN